MRIKFLTLGILIFFAGWGTGLLIHQSEEASTTDAIFTNSAMVRDDGYKYVSPLLMCGISEQVEPTAYEDLEDSVNEVISSLQENGDEVSVYFRELNSGEWFSINENQKYAPASLLKLPLFIAYLKMAEGHPEVLTKSLTLASEPNWNETQNFKAETSIVPGGTYNVGQLLLAMINKSDNNAAAALDAAINSSFKNEIYSDLGLDIPSDSATEAFMKVKDYSHFFRVLYNASYLSHENSEQALKVMTENHFSEGLAAGISENIEIAEKFGERKVEDSAGNTYYELHDCGIIYTESNPYLLCVMTKSSLGFEHLSELIEEISRAIFEELSSPYAENTLS